jgi:hypothetical protein
MTKQEAVSTIMKCLRVLYSEAEMPAAKPSTASTAAPGSPAGWQLAKIAAVSEKEVQTKRGPVMKLGLCFKGLPGTTADLWASTFDEALRREAAKFSKGDMVEVYLEQRGDFWNFKEIRSGTLPTRGIQADEVPF